MSNITEEQRDRLLDLCETSKLVSRDYDLVNGISEQINSLSDYISEQYGKVNIREMNDNVQEKLNDINNYIDEELIGKQPDWYNEIIQEMDSLFKISDDTAHDSIVIKDLINELKTQAGKDFIK